MTKEVTQPVETVETETVTPEAEAPSLNAQAKNLPWVQELMAKSKKLDDMIASQEAAAKEKEIKDLESKGEYEAAIKARDDENERLKTQHASELQERDLVTELLKAGASNDVFNRGAIAAYNADDGTIAEYVANLAKDESNKAFFGGQSAEQRQGQGEAVKAAITGAQPDWDKVKRMEKSSVREERMQAREMLSKHRKETGSYPY